MISSFHLVNQPKAGKAHCTFLCCSESLKHFAVQSIFIMVLNNNYLTLHMGLLCIQK